MRTINSLGTHAGANNRPHSRHDPLVVRRNRARGGSRPAARHAATRDAQRVSHAQRSKMASQAYRPILHEVSLQYARSHRRASEARVRLRGHSSRPGPRHRDSDGHAPARTSRNGRSLEHRFLQAASRHGFGVRAPERGEPAREMPPSLWRALPSPCPATVVSLARTRNRGRPCSADNRDSPHSARQPLLSLLCPHHRGLPRSADNRGLPRSVRQPRPPTLCPIAAASLASSRNRDFPRSATASILSQPRCHGAAPFASESARGPGVPLFRTSVARGAVFRR